MAVARPADLRAARGVVVALPAPETGASAAGPASRVTREKFATRPASGPLRKRPPPPSTSAAGPSSSLSSNRPMAHPPLPLPHRKRTRDGAGIPLSICQGCRIDTGSSDALEVLESKWRALLLCSDCHRVVRSRDACAYCFQKLPGEYPCRRVVDCVDCKCRVHLVCIPGQRGYITPHDMDPSLFSCVDCSPISSFFKPATVGRPKPQCSPSVVKGMMKDLVRDATAYLKSKAIVAEIRRQEAMDMAEVAELAADKAKDAYDYALLACQDSPPCSSSVKEECVGFRVPDDEELALKLHLAMNGSQRVSRSQQQQLLLNHQNILSHSKRAVSNGYLTYQRMGPKTRNMHEAKVRQQDSCCANIDGVGASRPLGVKLEAEQPSTSSSSLITYAYSSRKRNASVGKDIILDPVIEEPTGEDMILDPVIEEPTGSQPSLSSSSSGQEDGSDSEHLSSSSSSADESNDDQELVVEDDESLVEESSVVQVPILLDESSLAQLPISLDESSVVQVPVSLDKSSLEQVHVSLDESSLAQMPISLDESSPEQVPVKVSISLDESSLAKVPISLDESSLAEVPILLDESSLEEVPISLDESSLAQVHLKPNPPDRYLKKYTRNNKLRRTLGSKDIAGPASPVLVNCSSCVTASKEFCSNASFDVTVIAMDASANMSGSSGCQ